MRKLVGMLVFAVLAGRLAYAQEEFPAVRVAEMVKDSVVSVDVNSLAYSEIAGPLGREVSRMQRLLTRRLTGFVLSGKGYIVTDFEGLEEASMITVHLSDGTELDGEVVGFDEDYGVGVIKVNAPKPLKPVKLLETRYDPVKEVFPYDQGDSVIAIGYSGGLGGTVTYGIISAVRNLRNRKYVLIPNVIQADVAINDGNQGCPLFNDQGQVIAFHDRRGGGGGMQNTTFFLPIWLVKRVATEIIANYESKKPVEDFKVWHPWLGVKTFSGTRSPLTGAIREVGDDLKMYMDIPDQYWDVGILLDQVWVDSPASQYGLRDHDMLVLLEVRGKDEKVKVPNMLLKDIETLELLVTTADEGDIFVFDVIRNRKLLSVEVIIGQHPESFSFYSATSLQMEVSSQYF